MAFPLLPTVERTLFLAELQSFILKFRSDMTFGNGYCLVLFINAAYVCSLGIKYPNARAQHYDTIVVAPSAATIVTRKYVLFLAMPSLHSAHVSFLVSKVYTYYNRLT